MSFSLASAEYNTSIKIYYQHEIDNAFAERIIEYIWLEPDHRPSDENFKLIQNTKASVYKMKFNNQIYYLKSYAHRDASKIIKNIIRPVEAIRCFQTAIDLSKANIPVLEPVLALTRRKSAFLIDSIFVTKEVAGVDLYTYLLEHGQNNPDLRKQIIEKIAAIWCNLINHNFLHLDPWLGNFIVHPPQNNIQLRLIDIDNIYSLPLVPQELLLIKNLAKLRGKQLNSFAATPDEIKLFLEELAKGCHVLNHSKFRSPLSHFLSNKSNTFNNLAK